MNIKPKAVPQKKEEVREFMAELNAEQIK